jgi:hypothetical protein
MTMLHVPGDAATLIRELGESIPAGQRKRFFERVLALLAGDKILSPAKISAACQTAQIELRIAPAVAEPAVV